MTGLHPVVHIFPAERRLSTLLVSPLEENHLFLERFFRRTNWDLFLSRSCRDACRQLKEHQIGVVVTDKELPDGDWKCLSAAAAHCPVRVPVVVTHCFSEVDALTEILDAGAYDVLAKPFDESEVRQVLCFAWQQWIRNANTVQSPVIGNGAAAAGSNRTVPDTRRSGTVQTSTLTTPSSRALR